jgi:hypothetical protein
LILLLSVLPHFFFSAGYTVLDFNPLDTLGFFYCFILLLLGAASAKPGKA